MKIICIKYEICNRQDIENISRCGYYFFRIINTPSLKSNGIFFLMFMRHKCFFYFYPFVQPEGDDSYQKLEQRFHSMWQTSFIRLIQEGIIQTEDIEVVAKTIIYALQGMIMLSFSSNGATQKEDIKDELIKLANYLFKKNKGNY